MIRPFFNARKNFGVLMQLLGLIFCIFGFFGFMTDPHKTGAESTAVMATLFVLGLVAFFYGGYLYMSPGKKK